MNSRKHEATKDDSHNLKVLNTQYTECIAKEFLPKFFAGENVSIDNFCVDLRQKMLSLDKKVYS